MGIAQGFTIVNSTAAEVADHLDSDRYSKRSLQFAVGDFARNFGALSSTATSVATAISNFDRQPYLAESSFAAAR